MKKSNRLLTMLVCLIAFSFTLSQASMIKRLPMAIKPKVIKVKLYHNDTLMIMWLDTNGDNKCDVAYLYEKNDGYYIENKFTCKQADECDEFILEPKV